MVTQYTLLFVLIVRGCSLYGMQNREQVALSNAYKKILYDCIKKVCEESRQEAEIRKELLGFIDGSDDAAIGIKIVEYIRNYPDIYFIMWCITCCNIRDGKNFISLLQEKKLNNTYRAIISLKRMYCTPASKEKKQAKSLPEKNTQLSNQVPTPTHHIYHILMPAPTLTDECFIMPAQKRRKEQELSTDGSTTESTSSQFLVSEQTSERVVEEKVDSETLINELFSNINA